MGVSRVSNQKLKRALESDLANYAVKKAQDQIRYNCENAKGYIKLTNRKRNKNYK